MTGTPNLTINPRLQRYPPAHKRAPLQAWDAADELLLERVATLRPELAGQRVLIVQDAFGALTCTLARALPGLDVTSYTDSVVAARAIAANFEAKAPGTRVIHTLDELTGVYDLALVKIPKNSSFFEDILCRLSHHLDGRARVIAGAMVKHLAPVSFELLERVIGATTTSLAKKKARLVFATFTRAAVASPYPLRVRVDGFEHPFVNHSNLFSRGKLDIGTRFFLGHLPPAPLGRVLDLGCGNGIVGIAARLRDPDAQVIYSDESRMAVDSARANHAAYFGDAAPATYHWINCFEDQPPASLDVVLCNPPFHQGTTLGDHVARQMFADAHHALRAGGLLRVIGNAHLGYPALLRETFGPHAFVDIVARNDKFVVIDAQRA